ncbi:MAG: hypothetical protein AB8H03_12825 [Saprospiraceae bacterium]
MKQRSTIIFLFLTNSLFAQDTLKNNFPTYFISQIELRYELVELNKIKTNSQFIGKYKVFSDLHQSIRPFSPDEFPPFFNLELSAKDIFEFKSGFEIESIKSFLKAENNNIELADDDYYSNSSWIISTNYDTKESVNFYSCWSSQNISLLKNQATVFSLFYQKEKFQRSLFAWNLNTAFSNIHFNLSYINNIFYQHESNTAIGNGNRRHVFFQKKYHEQNITDWLHSIEVQNQNISGSSIFANLLLSLYKKTYLKIESDLHWFILPNDKRVRQRFKTFGIGAKPIDGTIIFLEYTNRTIGFDQIPNFFFEEKPYFSLNAKRILKLKLFKR